MTFMDDQNNIIRRDRPNGGPIEPVNAPARLLTVGMMPREPHLMDYLSILRKHQWMILTFLLTMVTIVAIGTFRMQPIYEATTRIEIDRENTGILAFTGGVSQQEDDLDNYIETQSKVLASETLAQQTIKSLNLDQNPRFGGNAKDSTKLEVVAPTKDAQSPTPALQAFLDRLTVKRVPNSRLLDVTFATTDAKLAADVVNTHITNYIEQNFRSHYEATTQASNWLSGQLDELKSKVENAEDARIEYERDNQIWTIDE
jgi:succinoglycan biosynthesis transport protein ExoP